MSALFALLKHSNAPTHTAVVLSNMCGSLSLACWMILLLPQLLEQWQQESADGLAIGFIFAWLLGDLCNLLGALLAGLRPNVILLAFWFCFSDSLLVLSYFYYKRKAGLAKLYKRLDNESQNETQTPVATTPLLPVSTEESAESSKGTKSWLISSALPMMAVFAIATVGYVISDQTDDTEQPQMPLVPLILGYVSAAFYFVARIPQIVQNYRRKSVEGLSITFFALSMLGNLTYGGQILIYRHDAEWLYTYMPWLIGSLGTIIEDSIIFAQFFLYKSM